MALNKFMHDRNPYRNNPPDFNELAKLYPHFKKYVNYTKAGKPFVNFRNPEVVRSLAICLFEKDFNLRVELPRDRLAPTLPLRLNYLLWLEDLINCSPNQDNPTTILDIGCGSSCVYPLLGCRINKNWKFTGTEIDEKNVQVAKRNVENNTLNDRIKIRQVDKDGPLLGEIDFDICLCNPPFYTSETKLISAPGRPSANSSCSGDKCETVGGDYSYALKMFNESLQLQSQRSWYTIMLGKKSSLIYLKKLLLRPEIKSKVFAEFCQGRTMRWGAAWSYRRIDTSTIAQAKPKKVKPLIFSSKYTSITETERAIKKLLSALSIDFTEEEKYKFTLKGNICAAIPNRKARRTKAQDADGSPAAKKSKIDVKSNEDDFECILNVSPVDFAPPRIELSSGSKHYPDLLNRFYLHARDRL